MPLLFTATVLTSGANATFVHEASVWTKSPISDFYEIGSCDSNARSIVNSPQNPMTGPGWVQLVNEEKSFFPTRVSTHYNNNNNFYMYYMYCRKKEKRKKLSLDNKKYYKIIILIFWLGVKRAILSFQCGFGVLGLYGYLPEPSLELPKTPKQWLANVCVTVLHEDFSKWVKQQVELRHDKIAIKKDMMIKMDPEMAQIFRQSIAVSSKYNLINSQLILSLSNSE